MNIVICQKLIALQSLHSTHLFLMHALTPCTHGLNFMLQRLFYFLFFIFSQLQLALKKIRTLNNCYSSFDFLSVAYLVTKAISLFRFYFLGNLQFVNRCNQYIIKFQMNARIIFIRISKITLTFRICY